MTPETPEPIVVPPVVQPTLAAPSVLTYRTPDALQIPDGWTHVEIFQMDPALLASFVRYFILTNIGLLFFMTFVAAGFLFYLASSVPLLERLLVCAMVVVIAFASRAIAIFRQLAKTKRLWPVYRLIVADQGILQVRPGFPNVRVLPCEVRHLRETRDAFLIVKSNGMRITVPKRVVDLPRLRQRLSHIQPITRQRLPASVHAAATLFLGIVHLGVMMYAIYAATTPMAVLSCLCVMLLTSIVLAWRVIRIANFTVWQRVANIGVLAFMYFAVIARLAIVFFFPP